VTTRSIRVRPDQLAWREAGDEIVILDLGASCYHSLNATGSLLWRRLADWTSEEELITMLTNHFGVAPKDAARDVEQFVETCTAAGVVETQAAAPDDG
jgi:hypothetical protein